MRHPKVSVVATCYNHAAFLPDFLNSVQAQTFQDFELVVGDDASTDGSANILREAAARDLRINVIAHESTGGLSRNFNSVLSKSHGDYLAQISCDDLMHPHKLERQVAALEAQPDAVACLHWVDVFESTSGANIYCIDDHEIMANPADWFLNLALLKPRKKTAYPPAAAMWRREYVAGVTYDDRLPYKNEVLFAVECYSRQPRGRWICVPEVLARYRRHGNNLSASAHMTESLIDETKTMVSIIDERCPELSTAFHKVFIDFLARSLLYEWIPVADRPRREMELRRLIGRFPFAVYQIARLSKGPLKKKIGRLLNKLV